jgi:hypothetical protein
MALAGIILGSLWILATIGIVIAALAADPPQAKRLPTTAFPTVPSFSPPAFPTPSSSASTDSTRAVNVTVGDCLLRPPIGEVKAVDTVPCSSPHKVEAYSVFTAPGTTFPGDARLTSIAQDGCLAKFTGFVGKPLSDSSLDIYYLAPSSRSWTSLDDRTIVCLLESPTSVSGTLRGSGK